LNRIESRIDSSVVAASIVGSSLGSYKERILVDRIKELLNRNWIVSVKYIYWEANKCADFLAQCCSYHSPGLIVYDKSKQSVK